MKRRPSLAQRVVAGIIYGPTWLLIKALSWVEDSVALTFGGRR